MPALGWLMNLDFAGGTAVDVTQPLADTRIRRAPNTPTYQRRAPEATTTSVRRAPNSDQYMRRFDQ
jgi:hypothetical protein